MTGTNFYTIMPAQSANHYAGFADENGYVLFGKFDTAATPDTTANVFQKGCIMAKTDAANSVSALYQNTGTLAAPAWTLMPIVAGGTFALPESVTDSTSTTGTSLGITESALTTGVAQKITASSLTTGTIFEALAAAGVLTTGRYYSANDGSTEVFGIGTNGHIISTASAAVPTIAVGTANGITAAAITAGGSDTCGDITTTGTSTGGTVLNVTFGKTYTVAPKYVHVSAGNAAAASPNTGWYVSAVSATGFSITVAGSGTYGATPSFRYLVIA